MRKAIFWDFDGTLTVPHHMWSVSLLKALGPLAEEYGITWEKIRPFTHSGFPWDEDGAGHLTGQAWWDCMLEKFSHAYLHFGIPKAKMCIRDRCSSVCGCSLSCLWNRLRKWRIGRAAS